MQHEDWSSSSRRITLTTVNSKHSVRDAAEFDPVCDGGTKEKSV
jgi:hypothetical protein